MVVVMVVVIIPFPMAVVVIPDVVEWTFPREVFEDLVEVRPLEVLPEMVVAEFPPTAVKVILITPEPTSGHAANIGMERLRPLTNLFPLGSHPSGALVAVSTSAPA